MSWSRHRRRLVATALIGATVSVIAGLGWGTDRFDGVQNHWEDLLQPGLEASPDVVVVAIDRDSVAATAAGWPWPRDLHADLLDALGAGGPAVVLYDVLFAEPRAGDDALEAAIRRTPTVLPSALTLGIAADGAPRILDEVMPTERFASAAAGIGHSNVSNAGDTGVVRSLPFYAVDDREIARPSAALAAIAVAEGHGGVPLIERPDGVQVGSRFVPLDDAELQINWSSTLQADDAVSALDVLTGGVAPTVFADRIVVVGVTEPTLGDQHLVPVDRSGGTSGVIVLANAANTVLTSGYLDEPSSTRQLASIALAALAAAAAFAWLPLVVAPIVSLSVAAVVVLFNAWRFHTGGVLWNVVWPLLAALLAAGAGIAWRYATETRHRRHAWRLFSAYVPASVVRQLEDPHRLADVIAGARCDVTVLFCDLRGFTPIAASMEPAQVRELLDTYYSYAVGIVHGHGGTVMQFVGDEVFAVFGAPIPDESAASAAFACAAALQDGVAVLDAQLGTAGLPSIRFGIGVHRGPVVAAHVGTTDRRQYAVVGDAVNVGSRLCGRALAGDIVVSAAAWQSVFPDDLRNRLEPEGTIELKGVADPVAVYRAGALPPTAQPA